MKKSIVFLAVLVLVCISGAFAGQSQYVLEDTLVTEDPTTYIFGGSQWTLGVTMTLNRFLGSSPFPKTDFQVMTGYSPTYWLQLRHNGTVLLDTTVLTNGEYVTVPSIVFESTGMDTLQIWGKTDPPGNSIRVRSFRVYAYPQLQYADDEEEQTSRTTWIKVKSILIGSKISMLQLRFDLRSSSGSYVAYGRIYKNGVAYGTERSTNSTSWVTYTENLVFQSGDIIDLHIRIANAAASARTKNFRIYGTKIAGDFRFGETGGGTLERGPEPYFVYRASDVLLYSSDAEVSTTSTTYVMFKPVWIACRPSTFRIRFDMKATTGWAFGRPFKGDTAVGTERSTSSTSYITYTEDIKLDPGDKLQLGLRMGTSGTTYARNFRIYGTKLGLDLTSGE